MLMLMLAAYAMPPDAAIRQRLLCRHATCHFSAMILITLLLIDTLLYAARSERYFTTRAVDAGRRADILTRHVMALRASLLPCRV